MAEWGGASHTSQHAYERPRGVVQLQVHLLPAPGLPKAIHEHSKFAQMKSVSHHGHHGHVSVLQPAGNCGPNAAVWKLFISCL